MGLTEKKNTEGGTKLKLSAKIWLIVCIVASAICLLVNIYLFHFGATHEILGGFYFFAIALGILGVVSYAFILKRKKIGSILSYVMAFLSVIFLAFFMFGIFTDGFSSDLWENLTNSIANANGIGLIIIKFIFNFTEESLKNIDTIQLFPVLFTSTSFIMMNFVMTIISPIITKLALNSCRENAN